MKKFRKLIPALALLLVSAVLMSTASYAWFSMNNKVTVTGMEVKTKVSDSLYIAPSTAGNDKEADSNFKSALHQVVTGTLQPVSTVSGVTGSFFTTTDAGIDGRKASSSSIVPYTVVSGATVTVDNTDYKAYVDYIVELKAVNTSENDKIVALSTVNLLYQGALTNNHAFRVAVFAQEQADTNTTLATEGVSNAYEAIDTSADSILAPTSFAYFTTNNAVKTINTLDAVTPAVNSTGWSSTVGSGKILYYKLTIRLWLEGEDTDCYNTKFVGLDSNWQLDLAFTLDQSATAATKIGSVENATNSLSNNVFTAALTNGKTAASYQWYNAGSGLPIENQTTDTYSAPTNNAITTYCKITTTDGNVYYTPSVEYAPSNP